MYGSVEARRRRENFGDILLQESDFLLFLQCFRCIFEGFLLIFGRKNSKICRLRRALFQMSKFNKIFIEFLRCQNPIKFLLNFSDPELLNSILFYWKNLCFRWPNAASDSPAPLQIAQHRFWDPSIALFHVILNGACLYEAVLASLM